MLGRLMIAPLLSMLWEYLLSQPHIGCFVFTLIDFALMYAVKYFLSVTNCIKKDTKACAFIMSDMVDLESPVPPPPPPRDTTSKIPAVFSFLWGRFSSRWGRFHAVAGAAAALGAAVSRVWPIARAPALARRGRKRHHHHPCRRNRSSSYYYSPAVFAATAATAASSSTTSTTTSSPILPLFSLTTITPTQKSAPKMKDWLAQEADDAHYQMIITCCRNFCIYVACMIAMQVILNVSAFYYYYYFFWQDDSETSGVMALFPMAIQSIFADDFVFYQMRKYMVYGFIVNIIYGGALVAWHRWNQTVFLWSLDKVQDAIHYPDLDMTSASRRTDWLKKALKEIEASPQALISGLQWGLFTVAIFDMVCIDQQGIPPSALISLLTGWWQRYVVVAVAATATTAQQVHWSSVLFFVMCFLILKDLEFREFPGDAKTKKLDKNNKSQQNHHLTLLPGNNNEFVSSNDDDAELDKAQQQQQQQQQQSSKGHRELFVCYCQLAMLSLGMAYRYHDLLG